MNERMNELPHKDSGRFFMTNIIYFHNYFYNNYYYRHYYYCYYCYNYFK